MIGIVAVTFIFNTHYWSCPHLSRIDCSIYSVLETHVSILPSYSSLHVLMAGRNTSSCRTRFDDDDLTAAKMATCIAIIRLHHRNHTHPNLYRSCLPIFVIAIVKSVLFYFLISLRELLTFPSLSNSVLR